MKHFLILSIMVLIGHCGMAQINFNKIKSALGGEKLSSEDVGKGLKEALTKGVSKGSDLASQVDGYLKNSALRMLDKFIVALNRAAEDAAKEAKPIFISAIKQMTIEDAWSILRGEDNAATQYLNRTTSGQLHEKFKPVIQRSLEKVSATRYYNSLINAYNKIPFVKEVNPDLGAYATGRAVDGLFIMVAQEEKNIRDNPGARISELLKKVFGAQ